MASSKPLSILRRTLRLGMAGSLLCTALAVPGIASTLSAYDRVAVNVVNGDEFSSDAAGYLVGTDGNIFVPQLGRVPAAGREEADLQEELTKRLSAYLRVPDVTVRLVSVSPVNVDVSGAVYRPGLVTLSTGTGSGNLGASAGGASRTVYNAIQAAGGVRPDADLAGIELERDGKRTRLAVGQDMPVINSDKIIVTSLGPGHYTTNNTPSQLAPTTITVYVSGQDVPSTNGPLQLKPGTTVSGALSAAGGAGGNFLKGDRVVSLIRTDPVTEKRMSQEIPIGQVIDGSNDPKLVQYDRVVVQAGPSANASGFLQFLQPILNPLVWLFR
ncbi:polysaccharide biosynthesis/export family protein [Gloeobacter kilaueensis]|uniref:Polysaccharide export protein n=1 Tax=Gloeobacter kilaueensis (strain ATCC BAA-2537 / CCAP 1431/1 / ULC 316 / JS1) TaxID=1183438 RepID=U5QFQ7_GLOK1|nr:polysaccharide biosynthesis/export family protein [Gloeobacter kilaueensis]AGY56515.1 polysaccharide export protein [Gloeobacter kilaueensis JS1]